MSLRAFGLPRQLPFVGRTRPCLRQFHAGAPREVKGDVPDISPVLPDFQSGMQNWLVAQQPNKKLIRMLMDSYQKEKRLPQDVVVNILDAAIAMHEKLPNVLQLARPKKKGRKDSVVRYTGTITVVGDTHGQYDDFAQILQNRKIGGFPSKNNQFVFNGDIVDRGPKAVEIMMVVLFAKLQCPSSVHLLRGNHETRGCTKQYGFEKEVLKKYDATVYEKFVALFDTLPFAAVLENEVFVVHGGLGAGAAEATIEQLNQWNRFAGPENGDMFDTLLWSDPHPTTGGTFMDWNGRPKFGADVTKAFLEKNNLKHLVRSHEVQKEGHSTTHDGLCTTVFSAPNYCGYVNNLGAVLRYDKPDSMQPTAITFKSAPLPKNRRNTDEDDDDDDGYDW